MINYESLYDYLAETPAQPWLSQLTEQVTVALAPKRKGNFGQWQQVVSTLPVLRPTLVDLQNQVKVGQASDLEGIDAEGLAAQLKQLCPWRKGPFDLFGVQIESEWHSDWKWNRLKDHIQPLTGRMVLDVGCGNGYYGWRMAGAGARLVVGLDPALLVVMQYAAIRCYLPQPPVYVLPLKGEQLPVDLPVFDTVFSMGVLYHRRSPLDHLQTLAGMLRSQGELVLETLVIDGGPGDILIPEDRYAQMRNVWAIPSCLTLETWLAQAGFRDIRIVNVTPTTLQEQRQTPWMTSHSLAHFLDPTDHRKTIEGYPGPLRAVAIAQAP